MTEQPAGVAWPTDEWPIGPPTVEGLDDLMAGCFDDLAQGPTLAVAVVQGGVLRAERYADGVTADTTLPSWSMAKSIQHALYGIVIGDGRVALTDRVVDVAPGAVPQWSDPGDPRRAITIDDLLHFRDGLAWTEDYLDDTVSDVIEMLFGSGQDDVAAYVADRPLASPPGDPASFCYSSGTSNLLAAVLRELYGPNDSTLDLLRDRLLVPIGMTSAQPKCDARGTWVASSYCYATARDFLRFGLLALRDGVWDGQRLLPEGWVAHGHTMQPQSIDGDWIHGAQWWGLPGRDDLVFASGWSGQLLFVVPDADLLVLRLATSDATHRLAVFSQLLRIIDAHLGHT